MFKYLINTETGKKIINTFIRPNRKSTYSLPNIENYSREDFTL